MLKHIRQLATHFHLASLIHTFILISLYISEATYFEITAISYTLILALAASGGYH